MKKVCFLALSTMLFLTACGESSQEKLARITLEQQELNEKASDKHFCYTQVRTKSDRSKCELMP